MATSAEYIEFVCGQIAGVGAVRYRKMFGEYMVYVNDKPVLLVCDNTVYVKKLPQAAGLMDGAPCGVPYEGAKEHYILDIDDAPFARQVAALLETVTPLPKPRKKKA
jgi:TfoX/Sxy family transcriptional regulator of competence genes